jgi:hypothetical protein
MSQGKSMKKLAAALVVTTLSLGAGPASASWTPTQLSQLVTSFENGVSANYSYTSYPFQFFSLADCYKPGAVCPFPNPDGPYGQPQINTRYTAATTMGPTDAMVMIMETPPQMLYYGVTPYMYTRYYQQIPGQPTGTSGTRETLESINDSVDMSDLLTTGSSTPGVNSFSQLTAIIMTADQTTYDQLKQAFTAVNFTAVNLIDMPYSLVPLKMGTGGERYDTYSMMMRMAYPTDATAMQTYMDTPPISFLYLTPKTTRTIAALPSPVYKVPGDGSSEPTKLQTARDRLVSQLETQYGSSYTITEQTQLELLETQNYACIDSATNCGDDNPDAFYTHDIDTWVPKSLQDKLLIVGVNHVSQGRATYISHSVLNMTHQAGVVAVNQQWFGGSGLTMGGVTSKSDPRYANYSQLYAFTMSYDCTGELVCLTIPQPTSTNPVGVAFGDTVGESLRAYVDPKTHTRPDSTELILQRVFVLTKK